MPPKGYVNISLLRSIVEAIEGQHDYTGSIAGYIEKMIDERSQLEERARERGAVAGWIAKDIEGWTNAEIVKLAVILLNELGKR